MNEDKLFDGWTAVKKNLQKIKQPPLFREGEIWWAAVGKNIGVEINGKSKKFSRPVLVFCKYTRLGFLAIPIISKEHAGSKWYVEFKFQDRVEYAVLSQLRVLSSKRLYSRMGIINEKDSFIIQKRFNELYNKKCAFPTEARKVAGNPRYTSVITRFLQKVNPLKTRSPK